MAEASPRSTGAADRRALSGRKVLVVDDHFEIPEPTACALGTIGCDGLTLAQLVASAERALTPQSIH
jgi:hypothetical protein